MSFTPFNYPNIDLKNFTRYSSLNEIPKSTADSLAQKGIIDIFPFKLVTLGNLIRDKRANNTEVWIHQAKGGPVWYFYRIFSKPSDEYIAVSDIMVREVGGLGSSWDNILVLFVKNDPKYSTLITKTSAAHEWVANDYDCGDYAGGFTMYSLKETFNNYKPIGSIMSPVRDGDPFTSDRVFAAVNPSYLIKREDDNRGPSWSDNTRCDRDWTVRYASPFSNFTAVSDSHSRMGNFYDIRPESLILQCCSNTADNLSNSCGEYAASATNNTCDSFMVSACKGNNLLKNECISYCKENNGKCDNELQKFCQSSPDIVDKYPDICSCFMTSQWYDYAKTQLFSSNPIIISKLKEVGAWGEPPECSFPKCQASSAIKPSKANSTPCKNLQIQNCINTSTLSSSSGGTMSVRQLDQSQANNCVQSSTTTNVQTPSPTPLPVTTTQNTQSSTPTPLPSTIPGTLPKPTPSEDDEEGDDSGSKTWLWVGIGITIFIIILIILIILLRR